LSINIDLIGNEFSKGYMYEPAVCKAL